MGLAVPDLELLGRLFWTSKVRHGQPGRRLISREVRDLTRKMCRENPSMADVFLS